MKTSIHKLKLNEPLKLKQQLWKAVKNTLLKPKI